MPKLTKNASYIFVYVFLCLATSWIFAFGILAAIVGLVCLPIWWYESTRLNSYPVEYFTFFIAGGIWFLLSSLGIGAQSLANLIELVWLGGYIVFASYLSVLLGRKFKKKVVGLCVIASAIVVAILFLLLTPSIPE